MALKLVDVIKNLRLGRWGSSVEEKVIHQKEYEDYLKSKANGDKTIWPSYIEAQKVKATKKGWKRNFRAHIEKSGLHLVEGILYKKAENRRGEIVSLPVFTDVEKVSYIYM